MNSEERIHELVYDAIFGLTPKEKIKYYIQLTEETIKQSTDLILLEKCEFNLKNLNDSLLDILSNEYYISEIDINN
jgi:hypothetical protein